MAERFVVFLVDTARRFSLWVLLAFALLTVFGAMVIADRFAINTDVTKLLDENVDWRQREIAFLKAFPQRDDLILIVIDGQNAVDTDLAAEKLKTALQQKADLFKTVTRPESSPYFQQNGLKLLPINDLADTLDNLIKAQPLLAALATDPSPRGLFAMLSLMVDGFANGQVKEDEITPLFNRTSSALEKSWLYLFTSENPTAFELRRFVLVQPVLDYSALSPGEKATGFIRHIIHEQNLAEKYNVLFHLTGPVPLADEEFASIAQGMETALAGSFFFITFILYFTLKSWRIILPVIITLLCGLVATTAAALFMVPSLNLISVAFAVMFLGIAVDFGIQFGVRTREARLNSPDLAHAMHKAAVLIAIPFLLAALSNAAAFFSFTPTSYRGVAELGLIAGVGMVVAFTFNLTLLPALLTLTKPQAEKEAIGFIWAAPIDSFLLKKQKLIIASFAVIFLVMAWATFTSLRFDFDPLNLKNEKSESVATMFDLAKNTDTSPYVIDILAPNLNAANILAAKLAKRPEVAAALTLQSLVPEEQEEKRAYLQDANTHLALAFHTPTQTLNPSADDIRNAASALSKKIIQSKLTNPSSKKLLETLQLYLSQDDNTLIGNAAAMAANVQAMLAQLKSQLALNEITFSDIPDDLSKEWIAADGATRIEVHPTGNMRDPAALLAFVTAVKEIAPEATGAPISIHESAQTIKKAFLEAALYSTLMIFLVLMFFLKNIKHTLFVLSPLILAFFLTLGTASLFSLPINFANIIAMPLLLGLGVSYSIYFVIYWLQANNNPLQSSMARAVLSSAATTVVAFGSLSLSQHLGTSSMGLLLTLSLFYVLVASFLFLPAFLGEPIKCKTK